MKQNKYDNPEFFNKYQEMERSQLGLVGAGEWHAFEKMMPNFKDKTVLDLGCGFGWYSLYAAEHGAKSVIGVDISEKMLAEANKKNNYPNIIKYINSPIEDIEFPQESFDVVLSSLTFHYLNSFSDICAKVNNYLTKNGEFIFSVEHPVFTAEGSENWFYNDQGQILHWPVDNYFSEGVRETNFLGEKVFKYHRTLTTYISELLNHGFEITNLVEPKPDSKLLATVSGMEDELRRPMMLLIAAKKVNHK
ncbi:class I SAM-dependent methyltransferase [Spiroplasma sp. DGKH1]|uniref:class I SAM-dependent methyltransferase n=1 Tax=Spiroplasma sp. DGKH1 TaxID=3050074 RepID=UPI0034C5B591